MKQARVVSPAILVLALVSMACLPLNSSAIAPLVPFAEIARASDCIFVADYSTASARGQDEQDRTYSFKPTAVVAGRDCSATAITVFRNSDESPAALPDGAYLLFLKRRDTGAFVYTREPFSILRIKGGQVGTASFRELSEKLPLEEMLTRIRVERGD